MKKPQPVEPEILAIIEATGLTPSRITFAKMPKPIFTIDDHDGEPRVIYSAGFLEMIRKASQVRA